MALLALGLAAAPAAGAPAGAPFRHDFLLFGSAAGRATDGLDDPTQSTDDMSLALDVLFDLSYREARLLGEYVLTDEETELERLQVGWEPNEHVLIWLGRYHQPSSYWNQRFHHGQYLQTPITRPRIEEWEDTSGLLPQHMVGALLESNWRLRERGTFELTLGLGVAPSLDIDSLDPYSLLHGHDGPVGAAYNMRLDYHPGSNPENAFGVLLSHNEIAVTPRLRIARTIDFSHIDQNIVGSYVDWNLGAWRTLGTVYYVATNFDGSAGDAADHFLAGYLEIERPIAGTIAAFSRYEFITRSDKSRYLALFPERIRDRSMAGVRWDYARKQALKFEAASVRSPIDRYLEFRLEWSIALP